MKISSLWHQYEQSVPSFNVKLGSTYSENENEATFSLWAPGADSVNVLIYKNPDESYIKKLPLELNEHTKVWFSKIEFNKLKPLSKYGTFFYEYEITRGGESKICLDPYAFSLSADKSDGKLPKAALIDFSSPRCQPGGGWNNCENDENGLYASGDFSTFYKKKGRCDYL